MYGLEELKARGRMWRHEFSKLNFIGELEVDEQEVARLCHSLGRYLLYSSDEDFCSALTVAVVNLAYFVAEEDDDGFRFMVLRRLGVPIDDSYWENHVGAPILRLLIKYFNEENSYGPYRYVRPIMRHAGIPARAINQFAGFFSRLVNDYGWGFSESEYKTSLEKQSFQSQTLRDFLKSLLGWQFCRDIARILRNRKIGIFSEQALALPGFRARILDVLWEKLNASAIRNRSDSVPRPRLLLDLNELRLAIEFAERGLNVPYRWADGRTVLSSPYLLKDQDCRETISGSIRQPSGLIEHWEIKPWNPEENPWAVFNANGVFLQSSGSLRPGRYLLALPKRCVVPQPVILEYGDLNIPRTTTPYHVIECELPSGFSIAEINLHVRPNADHIGPSLRFATGESFSRYTHNVFVGKLPVLEVVNWDPDFASRYVIIVRSANQTHAIPESYYQNKGLIRLDVPAPSQGMICLEPKGRTPAGFMGSELSYTLLPHGRLSWPEGLHQPDEEVTITFDPAELFDAKWDQEKVTWIAPGRWNVPPYLDFAEGCVTYDGNITFSISGSISRIRIESPSIKERLLWHSDLEQRADLRMILSAAECGKRIDLGIVADGSFSLVAKPPPVPRSSELIISTDDIRDGLDTQDVVAGVIAARLPDSRIVCSEVTYLNEQQIIKHLCDPAEDDGDWINLLPDGLKEYIRAVGQLPFGPQKSLVMPALALPQVLKDMLLEYEVCNRVLDFDGGDDALVDLNPCALRDILEWYVETRIFLASGRTLPHMARTLLMQSPQDFSPLRIQRWRCICSHAESRLAEIASFLTSIKEWNGYCRKELWEKAKHSAIGRMPGGGMLTDAASYYYQALERRSARREDEAFNWFLGAKEKLDSVKQEAPEGLISEIASALKAMVFFHVYGPSGDEFRQQVKTFIDELGDRWAGLKCTLKHLCGFPLEDFRKEGAITLSDISPHIHDIELEEKVNER